jgi:hypothetical protein
MNHSIYTLAKFVQFQNSPILKLFLTGTSNHTGRILTLFLSEGLHLENIGDFERFLENQEQCQDAPV